MIEYTEFYGSIQIFNYLLRHNVELTSSLWYYAIHGRNAEIIHILEDNNIMPYDESYLSYLVESIKCHHNDIANFFLCNFLENEDENLMQIFNKILKYYNFTFMKNEFISESSFYHLCKNDYITLVNFLLKTKEIDINKKHKKITSLYNAVEKVHIEIINLLINNNKLDINSYNTIIYDYNKTDFQEKTALYLAVEDENIEIIKLLLSKNTINVNKFNNVYNNGTLREQKTALHLAVEKNNNTIVKLFLQNHKININILNKMNYYIETAFYLAVDNENIEIIKLLLTNNNIDINVPSEEIYYSKVRKNKTKKIKNIINTPLHIATEKSNYKLVELLLQQKNINVHIKNYDGKIPIECTKSEHIKQLFSHLNV